MPQARDGDKTGGAEKIWPQNASRSIAMCITRTGT